ncbi:sigma-70 family RNA polymerase sigma factor [Paenibacillus sp. SC116]|uniref:RNA polymerase sigma factor n=1 Tax=Paenibacillus sp. SC116 TaxID=2968986 RepID=UPI00215B695C|nr:sigma-70 family RNA polymerase sigma factor [Paenibacillus sp. SC116]MCR8846276.1 sigma-70 family RNA polymerase sigma factor [Paenibacillus sp. SC116]
MNLLNTRLYSQESTKHNKSDEQLVQQIIAGEQEAMNTLVERHRRFVLTCICQTVKDRHLAEDIAQDVWIKVYRSLHTFRGEAKFTTWLYRLTRNQLIDTLRKWKFHLQTDSLPYEDYRLNLDNELVSSEELPEEHVLKQERCEQVRETLRSMPLKYRSIMVMYHLRDRSYTEIAEQLSMPVRTVETRLYRAKALFKNGWGQAAEIPVV